MSDIISRELPHRRELPYRAILSEKNGKFYFYQPELNIIASGDDVAAAYENFSDVKLAFLHEIERAGLEDELAMPRTRAARGSIVSRDLVGELGMFVVKAAIVLVLVAAGGTVGMLAAKQTVSRAVVALGGGSTGLASLVKHASLIDLASNAARHAQAIPAERKEQLRDSVAVLAQEAKPIIEAFEAPFATGNDKAAAPLNQRKP